MEQDTNPICREIPSLLVLDDDCLRDIFMLLQLRDFVHLAVTCSRLLRVAQQCKKYKNISVTKYGNGPTYTKQEFAKIITVIGGNVTSLDVNGTFNILNRIADIKVGITEFDSYYSGQSDGQPVSSNLKSLQHLLPFRNLKELKVSYDSDLSIYDWKHFFENNRGIESLEYADEDRHKCLPLLQMLSELKILTINHLKLHPKEFHHLSELTRLTKLSFSSPFTCCNLLLVELAQKLNLVELDFYMQCDADTFAAVKSFLHLEVLSIVNSDGELRVPENTMFPPMLKKIKLDFIRVSCSNFLSIVKQLTRLEEFDIGSGGTIFWDNIENEYFPMRSYGQNRDVWILDYEDFVNRPADIEVSRVSTRIAKELRVEKRKLKITYNARGLEYDELCKYSDNLEIFIRRWDDEMTFGHTFRLK